VVVIILLTLIADFVGFESFERLKEITTWKTKA
jgi:hypothetical protein